MLVACLGLAEIDLAAAGVDPHFPPHPPRVTVVRLALLAPLVLLVLLVPLVLSVPLARVATVVRL